MVATLHASRSPNSASLGKFCQQLVFLTKQLEKNCAAAVQGRIQIESPNFSNVPYCDDGIITTNKYHWQAFVKALREYEHDIHTFSVYQVHLRKGVLDMFLPALQRKTLKRVVLELNDFGRYGILFMAHVLKEHPTLAVLESYGNNFDDLESAVTFSEALANNSCLERLILVECDLGRDIPILSAITNAIKRNIKFVNFNNNQIGLRGAEAISNLFASNLPNLEKLYLCNNFINDEDSSLLSQTLADNNNLRILNLRGNHLMTREGYNAFYKVIFDDSNLNSIVDSNHTCQLRMNGEGQEIFGMNVGRDVKKICKMKLLFALHNRSNHQRSRLAYFNDVSLEIMPHVLELLQQNPVRDCNDGEESKFLYPVFDILREKVTLLFDI